MASVHIARWVDMDYMFNISAGVGRNRPNVRIDVMLIQYLLNQATNEDAIGPGGRAWGSIVPGVLNQDGICGEKTQKAIDYYQAYRNSNMTASDANNMFIRVQVAQDGAIDPWRFPSQFNFANATSGVSLSRTDTLVTLCYDAAKSDDFKSGSFSRMHPDLLKVLCSH